VKKKDKIVFSYLVWGWHKKVWRCRKKESFNTSHMAISPSTISISACTQSALENDKNTPPNQLYKMIKIPLINDENNLTQKWEKLFLKLLSEIFWISIFGTYF